MPLTDFGRSNLKYWASGPSGSIGLFHKLGIHFVGVLVIRALEVYTKAQPVFLKTPK